jgi:hypothetical protein
VTTYVAIANGDLEQVSGDAAGPDRKGPHAA